MPVSIECYGETLATNPSVSDTTILDNHVFLLNSSGVRTLTLNCYDWMDNLGGFHAAPFQVSELDPGLIAGAIGVGFFCMLPIWAAVYGVRRILDAIR